MHREMVQWLIFGASLLCLGTMAAIAIPRIIRSVRAGPLYGDAGASNRALSALAQRLGLRYHDPHRMGSWTDFGYAIGLLDGYPIVIGARCREMRASNSYLVHTVIRVGLSGLASSVSPVVLRRILPASHDADPDDLFRRCFGTAQGDAQAPLPPPAARDALLALAVNARVLVVEGGGLHVVPGTWGLRLLLDVDELEGWARRAVQAATRVGSAPNRSFAGDSDLAAGRAKDTERAEGLVGRLYETGLATFDPADFAGFAAVLNASQFSSRNDDDRFPEAQLPRPLHLFVVGCWCAALAGAALDYLAWKLWRPVDGMVWVEAMLVGLAMLVLLVPVLAFLHRGLGYSRGDLNRSFFVAVAASLLSSGVLVSVNGALDGGKPVQHTVLIIKRYTGGDVTLRSWRPRGGTVSVSRVARDLRAKERAVITVHPGFFGWEWWSDLQPSP